MNETTTMERPKYPRTTRAWARLMGMLADYHAWKVIGLENVPAQGGAVITCTHSLASYDLFVMGCASKSLLGRQAYIVGDDLMFRLPGIAPVLHELGYIPRTNREDVVERLQQGTLIGIAPGGMKESLRSTRKDPYGFDWSDRTGFVWVALKAGVPIVPIVCPRSNEIFTVYDNPLTDWAYRALKIPVPVFRGLGPTLLPRPVELVSVIGAPIYPDVAPDQVQHQDVLRIHRRVVETTRALTDEVLRMSQSDLDRPGARGFPRELYAH